MPNYLLLLYPDEATAEQRAERQAEMPLWLQLKDSLREDGLLRANGQLHDPGSATTGRVTDGETRGADGRHADHGRAVGGHQGGPRGLLRARVPRPRRGAQAGGAAAARALRDGR